MNLEPIVKWSGSKRSQAKEIISRFPKDIDTYYEPFCGGCSVLYRLLNTPSVKVRHYVASDINADLIATWNEIKNNPDRLMEEYVQLWTKFSLCETFMLTPQEHRKVLFAHRKEFFYEIRDRLNREHRPADFLFIMRTTTNGMPRYNDFGSFNNSCHFSRPGIDPVRLDKICHQWSRLLDEKNVEFRNCSYEDIKPNKESYLYIDPPYFNTKGMYFGKIEFDKFWDWLKGQKCRWAMSFDGKRGDDDNTYDVPKYLYVRHEYLNSGKSSFERYLGEGRTEDVFESLYLNYQPTNNQSNPTQPEFTF